MESSETIEAEQSTLIRAELLAVLGCVGTLAVPFPLALSFLREWSPIAKVLLIFGLLIFGVVWIYFTARGLRHRSLDFFHLRSTTVSYVFLVLVVICIGAVLIVAQTAKADDLNDLFYALGIGWCTLSACFVVYIFRLNFKATGNISLTIATTALQCLNLLLIVLVYAIFWAAKDHENAQKDYDRFLRRRALQRYDGL